MMLLAMFVLAGCKPDTPNADNTVQPPEPTYKVHSVTMKYDGDNIEGTLAVDIVNKEIQITTEVRKDAQADGTVKYSSNNKDVATIDANGKIILVGEGETVIRAEAGGKTHSIVLIVKDDFTEKKTYTITVNTFEGGVATISTSVVEWHDSVTIRLVINRGYVMDAVLLNGEVNADATDALENRGVYTVNSIVNDVAFEIRLANKQYDVTFSGDYNKEYEIRQDGVITKHLTAVSGVIVNQGSLLKEEKAYYTSDMPHSFDVNGKLISTGDDNENLNRTVYADKLTVVFNVPNGYKITAVSITMDNDGGVVSNLVLGESGLDADDGSGIRTYTIPSIKGNVKIHVEYAIKTYEVEYVQRSGGSYVSTGTTLVSHHELFTIDMVSDEGFFLANLVINGRNIPTVNTKDGMRYRYTTDVQGVNGLTRLEINDELVNGEEKITVMPTYDKQRYSVIFFINNLQITSFYQQYHILLCLQIASSCKCSILIFLHTFVFFLYPLH